MGNIKSWENDLNLHKNHGNTTDNHGKLMENI